MKIIFTFFVFILFFINSGCQTIENKSQSAIKKENEKLSKFLIYINKKYGITCERSFEVNKKEIIVGFSSTGCF